MVKHYNAKYEITVECATTTINNYCKSDFISDHIAKELPFLRRFSFYRESWLVLYETCRRKSQSLFSLLSLSLSLFSWRRIMPDQTYPTRQTLLSNFTERVSLRWYYLFWPGPHPHFPPFLWLFSSEQH